MPRAPCPVPRVPEQPSPRRPKKQPIHLGIPIAYRRPNLTGASEYPHGHQSSRPFHASLTVKMAPARVHSKRTKTIERI